MFCRSKIEKEGLTSFNFVIQNPNALKYLYEHEDKVSYKIKN
jgi:hypothetical protein